MANYYSITASYQGQKSECHPSRHKVSLSPIPLSMKVASAAACHKTGASASPVSRRHPKKWQHENHPPHRCQQRHREPKDLESHLRHLVDMSRTQHTNPGTKMAPSCSFPGAYYCCKAVTAQLSPCSHVHVGLEGGIDPKKCVESQ
jgi:hypothetical protein